MTELLSREEYAAIAATLDLPQRAFIDGGFRDACGGRTFASTNPATGELLAQVAACDAEDVGHAVASARRACARRRCCAWPSCWKSTCWNWR